MLGRYGSTNSSQIATQAVSTYENYAKIKGFEDVGYFLISYVVNGGEVTKNIYRNDTIDVSDIVVSLNDDVMARPGTNFRSKIASALYFLDFTKDGDWSWGTSHPHGTAGIDYLTIAEVTTDGNKNVGTITDKRGPTKGFRLKPDYMYPEITHNVTYEMFGAIGDGVTDDGLAIKQAHDYANMNNWPVKSNSKTYYIGNAHSIIIQTDVDWNGATFIIDENQFPDNYVFIISSKQPSQSINPSSVTTIIGTGTKQIPELAYLGKTYLYVENANKKQYIRYGVNADPGTNQRDAVILNNGMVETPFVWDFSAVTTVTSYPIDEHKLSIKNATFVSVPNSNTTNDSYMKKSINFTRSNTEISNITHTVQSGTVGRPNQGFYDFRNCSNVTFKNSVSAPRKWRQNQAHTAALGTYDISLYMVCNITFDNIDGFSLDSSYWGITGSNYVKNWEVYSCRLSRIDAHTQLNGLIVKDTILGLGGIGIIGGGNLTVDNLTTYADYVVYLRDDYGGTWDGDMSLKNITHKPLGTTPVCFFKVINVINQDFGYPCRFGRNYVTVENYVLKAPSGLVDFPLINMDTTTKSDGNNLATNAYKLPKVISFKNCSIDNLNASFYFDNNNGFSNLRSDTNFVFTVLYQLNVHGQLLDISPNVLIELDSIQFMNTTRVNGHLFEVIGGTGFSSGTDNYTSVPNAVIPKFTIRNCKNMNLLIFALPSIIDVENCEINSIYASQSGTRNILYANNCRISAKAVSTINGGYGLRVNRISSYFSNCQFNVPTYDGTPITPSSDATNNNNFRRAYDMFAELVASSRDFVVYANFDKCLFDNSIDFSKLISVSYSRQEFSKIGNSRYFERFLWFTANTASRPTNPPVNFQYYDTTLNKPIWWSGTNWIDATGTSV